MGEGAGRILVYRILTRGLDPYTIMCVVRGVKGRMGLRGLLARACPCLVDEELEPLRTRHANAVSSSDVPHRRPERSADEQAAEMARAQEWCLRTLSGGMEAELTDFAAGRAERRQRQQKSEVPVNHPTAAETDASTSADIDLERAVQQALPPLEEVASAELVDAARFSTGLAPLLAAAQVAADRAPVDAAVLIHSGCILLLQDTMTHSAAVGSAAAAQRLCYALRCLLASAPRTAWTAARQAVASSTLPRQIANALRHHEGRTLLLCEEALRCGACACGCACGCACRCACACACACRCTCA